MSNYLFYCKNCNTLEADANINAKIRCGECGGRYHPLYITEEEWDSADGDTKRKIIRESSSYLTEKSANVSEKNNTDVKIRSSSKFSILSIVALVISLFGKLSIVGLILAIVDLLSKGSKKKTLSVIAICLSLLVFVSSWSIGNSSRSSGTKSYKTSYTSDYSYNNSNSNLVGATSSQTRAYESARSYLNHSAFSREGLIEQLEYEGYSNSDATWAVDKSGADWYEQAEKSADSYLSHSAFSEEGLRDQLEYEGFTADQAASAAKKKFGGGGYSGGASKDNALKSAKSYLSHSAFSYSGLVKQLEYEGYPEEDATYAADNCGADWNEQAAKSAQSYLSHSSFSRSKLIDQLEYEGFTYSQATYGVEKNGL